MDLQILVNYTSGTLRWAHGDTDSTRVILRDVDAQDISDFSERAVRSNGIRHHQPPRYRLA